MARIKKEIPSHPNPLQDTTYDRQRTLTMDGEMIRTTIDGPEWQQELAEFVPRQCVSVFDGNESKSYHAASPTQALNDVFPFGSIDGGRAHPEVRINAILPLLLTYRPLYPTMTRFKKEQCLVAGAIGEIEGRHCSIVEQATGQVKLQCWVDVGRDCVIRRFVMIARGEPAFKTDISYERDSSYGWIPSGWNSVVLKPGGKVIESLLARVTDRSINSPIERSQFQLEFPAGTVVRDNKIRAEYVVTEGGGRRFITGSEAAREPNYEQLLSTESGMAGLPVGSHLSWSKWLLLVAASCAVVIVICHSWKRIRLRKGQT